MGRTLAVMLSALILAVPAQPALAQTGGASASASKAKPGKAGAPKAPADASTTKVVVTNGRKSDLVQLQAAESGSVGWKKVLGALKAGGQASAILPRPFNCRVNLHGTFADGQSMEADDVDVCAQKTLNLTD